MKKNRQEAILQIVRENAVATQDELIAQLNKAGFCVTQATASRDIKLCRNGIIAYLVCGVK